MKNFIFSSSEKFLNLENSYIVKHPYPETTVTKTNYFHTLLLYQHIRSSTVKFGVCGV